MTAVLTRRHFVGGALAALGAPAAIAAAPEKVQRVGSLVHGERQTPAELSRNPFRTTLMERGWVEGRNIVFEYRPSETVEALDDYATELLRLNVDVIVTSGTPATRAALRATKTVPIVMMVGVDPVATGLVTSLSRPGGNVTGVTTINPELAGLRLDAIKQILPKASRVVFMWNPSNAGNTTGWDKMMKTAADSNLELQWLPVRGPEDLDGAFARLVAQRAEALLVAPDGMLVSQRARLASLALKHRIPSFYSLPAHVEAGGLLSYSADWTEVSRHAALQVDKILRGARPADLPVEQPTKFYLTVNARTAKVLGLTLPAALMLRADRVIE